MNGKDINQPQNQNHDTHEKEDIKKFMELFDQIKQVSDSDAETEFWFARDLQKLLGYNDWRNFLSVIIKAKDFAAEITNFNVKKSDLNGETKITNEHLRNNKEVRETLIRTGIYPEHLPAEEDVKKLERKIGSENKKLGKRKLN